MYQVRLTSRIVAGISRLEVCNVDLDTALRIAHDFVGPSWVPAVEFME